MININGLNAASRDKKLAGLENVNVQNKAKSMQDMMSAEIMVTISKEAKKKQEEQRKQTELDMLMTNMENERKRMEEAEEGSNELGKIMKIFRRIARGDKVPPKDESKLLEYSSELYQAAKNAAMLAKNDEPKRYKSVFDEDDEDDIDDMVRALSDGEDGEVVIKESSGENTQVRE